MMMRMTASNPPPMYTSSPFLAFGVARVVPVSAGRKRRQGEVVQPGDSAGAGTSRTPGTAGGPSG